MTTCSRRLQTTAHDHRAKELGAALHLEVTLHEQHTLAVAAADLEIAGSVDDREVVLAGRIDVEVERIAPVGRVPRGAGAAAERRADAGPRTSAQHLAGVCRETLPIGVAVVEVRGGVSGRRILEHLRRAGHAAQVAATRRRDETGIVDRDPRLRSTRGGAAPAGEAGVVPVHERRAAEPRGALRRERATDVDLRNLKREERTDATTRLRGGGAPRKPLGDDEVADVVELGDAHGVHGAVAGEHLDGRRRGARRERAEDRGVPLTPRRRVGHRGETELGGREGAGLEQRVAPDAELLRGREEDSGNERADHDDRHDRDRQREPFPSSSVHAHGMTPREAASSELQR